MEPELTIVGAGLTGLTAAIEAAERGWRVTVAEAHAVPGGRARSLPAPFRANIGPHAIYVDGPWWTWLERRGLTPPLAMAPRDGTIVRVGSQLGPWPAGLTRAIAALPADAPAGLPFREWLRRHVSAATAEAIVGVIFIATFDHDPGRLSAAFARQLLDRTLAGGARYVTGGWSTLTSLLAERANGLGVQMRLQTRLPAVPAGPVILATSLAAARHLTGDRSLTWPSARVVAIDLGVRADALRAPAGALRAGGPGVGGVRHGDAMAGRATTGGSRTGPACFRIIDLDDRIYAARYTAADSSLAPPGYDLIQVSAACAPGERKADVERRVHLLLDLAWPGWRTAVEWSRSALRVHCTGALDLPDTDWRDRPAISRGDGLMVATDQSAAPGLLAEVGIAAARQAIDLVAGGSAVTTADLGCLLPDSGGTATKAGGQVRRGWCRARVPGRPTACSGMCRPCSINSPSRS